MKRGLELEMSWDRRKQEN